MMFKVNQAVNYQGCNWLYVSTTRGSIELKSPSKHINNVVVDKPYTKHIHLGWK